METIKRKINLKDFVEKFGHYEPCIDKGEYTGSSYGFIPYNIRLWASNIEQDSGYTRPDFPAIFTNENGMPKYYVKAGSDDIVYSGITYGTFAYYYNWLRNFINNSKYYTPKKRRDTSIWCEIKDTEKYSLFVNENLDDILEELPENMSGYTCGISIICINEDAETFYEKYFSVNDALEFFCFSNKIFGRNSTKCPEEIVNEWGEQYTLKPFAEMSVLIEEEIDEMGVHEEYFPQGISTGVMLITSAITSGETGYHFVESKLKYLVRDKTSVDDSGEELDFVFNGSNCELIYSIGVPCNATYNEKISAYTYDIISEIKIDEFQLEDYNIDEHQINETGIIYFKYIVGNLISDIDGTIFSDTSGGGIEYEETYQYTVLNKTFQINGVQYNRNYISIDYNTGIKPENFDGNKLYAKVKITERTESGFTEEFFVRDDKTIGFTDVSFTTGKIDIDRGASASYEAFGVIGEVNSLEDLENYHDDWFRIRGKND